MKKFVESVAEKNTIQTKEKPLENILPNKNQFSAVKTVMKVTLGINDILQGEYLRKYGSI